MEIFSNLYVSFQRKFENKSHNLAYCSSLQAVVVYNFIEIESTFSLAFLKLCGWLLIAPWDGFHLFNKETWVRLIPLHEGLLLDLLIFLLYLFQSVCYSKYSAKTTSFSILNVSLRFLHQFVRKHFRIFVTVMRSKFHFLLKFSKRGTLKKTLFCHVAFYLHGLICWRLTVSQ